MDTTSIWLEPANWESMTAIAPEAREAIISIRTAGFETANSIMVHFNGIRRFLSKLKRNKKGCKASAQQMRIVAIGSRVFVTSFQLAGVKGVKVDSSAEAFAEINKMGDTSDVGLVLLSDDIGKEIRTQLTTLRAKRPIPLIFELPSPGSKKEKVDYRALLKQILGV